jgi:hypothetical protein
MRIEGVTLERWTGYLKVIADREKVETVSVG